MREKGLEEYALYGDDQCQEEADSRLTVFSWLFFRHCPLPGMSVFERHFYELWKR
jgi:hypothetical protein